MSFVPAASPRAVVALRLVEQLQGALVDALAAVAPSEPPFDRADWLRDAGRHGGGSRRGTAGSAVFDRASVNVSQVQYDDLPDRKLASATALSAIVHPRHPRAPSIHLHVSHTELRDGTGYWRIMADLNPSHPDEAAAAAFRDTLRAAAPDLYPSATAQGDRYFWIPALGRTRGVAHFYLEQHDAGDFAADEALARRLTLAVIDRYRAILSAALASAGPASAAEQATQRAYHTLYLFQVTTLDRGTTSGLLVHDQNDVGILGSLPSTVDRALLASWADRVPAPQDALVRAIVGVLPASGRVDEPEKRALAAVIRDHYRRHPEAIDLQASADVVPPTVANHR
ncbi:MAG: coproporphyrinogen III oxidase [Myxococcota bacterium]